MIVTEGQAGNLWCSEFRRAGDYGNSDADGGRRPCCIASRCMMWHWFDNRDDQAITNPRGFCGKAGVPA